MFHEVGPEEASRRLLDVIPELITDLTNWQGVVSEDGQQLVDALQVDGLALHNGTLVPTTPAPAALEPQLSLLEQQLEASGYPEALTHYRQAADNLVSGNYEAANGQTRSFLESLFKNLCGKRAGKQAGNANAALQHLHSAHWLDDGEWNHLRSFWNDIQDNGPHAGLTTADEALFRLHYATAAARYLLTKT